MQLFLNMTRKTPFAPNEYYHVYQRGIEKRPIFLDEEDRRRFVRLLYACNTPERISIRSLGVATIFEFERGDSLTDVGAYCLMDNHFHLLLRERTEGGISAFMQKLMTAYTMYFNAKYNRSGRLYQGPFGAQHLNTDKYLKYIFAYIHLNPVSRIEPGWKNVGIRKLNRTRDYLEEYPYSSFKEYQGHERDESLVLNRSVFPRYFRNRGEFDSMIQEWLNIRGEAFEIEE